MKRERGNYKIGIYLEEILSKSNVTIKELSEMTGIRENLLRKYLVDSDSPSLTSIQKISKALNVDPNFFIDDLYFKDKQLKSKIFELWDYDLLRNIDDNSEKDLKNTFKCLIKLITKIFNRVSLDGKKELIKIIYLVIAVDLYGIAYDESNNSR